MRPEETFASVCLESALDGVDVTVHDDNSEESMYDLTLARVGVSFGACEVTATVDPNSTQLWKLANGRADRWIEPALTQGWIVTLEPSCHVKTLKKELPPLLVRLEQDLWDWDAREQVRALGVGSFRRTATNYPGAIYPLLDRDHELTGGIVPDTGDPLADWFTRWVVDPVRSDNLTKLGDTGLPERHLFIIAPGFSTMPFPAYDTLLVDDDAPLPIKPVDLPDPLTHVWFASTWDTGDVISFDGHDWVRHRKPVTRPS